MESFNISKRKYNNLKQLILPDGIISTEANFYKFNHLGKTMVFKSLHKTSGSIFANKLYTLEMLKTYSDILPDDFILPESLVSVDKEIKGFCLPYYKGDNLELVLSNNNISIDDKLLYLKKVGELLNKLSSIRKESNLKCIYINDLHASNFLVNKKLKELKVIDLDSCRICDSKPFTARYLTPLSLLNEAPGNNKYEIYQKDSIDYTNFNILDILSYSEYEPYYCNYKNYKDELGYINSNEDSDLYCYTIMFLNYLYGSNVGSFSLEQFYDYITHLERIGIDKHLILSLIKIVTSAPNENIMPYLDCLTPKQIEMAHKNVYEVTRMKLK